jgi:hypothetical protein
MTKKLCFVAVLALFSGLMVSCMSKGGGEGSKEQAEQLWGSERVCMPCHTFQTPIARNHNYRCDTCHRGNPWAEDEAEGHFELVKSPQLPQFVSVTCDRCHRRVLGRDVPYNAEFIRDVIVSHKEKPREMMEWQK